jgi:lipoate-protein ligase A
MSSKAPSLRLLNLGRVPPLQLHAAYTGLAEALSADERAGWLLLARSARGHIALGASQYADAELDLAACHAAGVPVIQRRLGGGTVWVDDAQLCVFFILPAAVSGAREDFFADCLDVLCETFGRLGLEVERVGQQDIWSCGAKLLGSGGATIGAAQVFGASLLERFDAGRFMACVAAPSPGFRGWLGELLERGMTDLSRLGIRATEPELVEALSSSCRRRWTIVDGSFDDAARRAVAEAAKELGEPLETGGRRLVRAGIKINRHSYLLEDAAGPWLRLVWRDGVVERAAAQDAGAEQALQLCVGESLREGLVSRAGIWSGMSKAAAAELESRVLELCRDAGR